MAGEKCFVIDAINTTVLQKGPYAPGVPVAQQHLGWSSVHSICTGGLSGEKLAEKAAELQDYYKANESYTYRIKEVPHEGETGSFNFHCGRRHFRQESYYWTEDSQWLAKVEVDDNGKIIGQSRESKRW